jgi:hypothetical protein
MAGRLESGKPAQPNPGHSEGEFRLNQTALEALANGLAVHKKKEIVYVT